MFPILAFLAASATALAAPTSAVPTAPAFAAPNDTASQCATVVADRAGFWACPDVSGRRPDSQKPPSGGGSGWCKQADKASACYSDNNTTATATGYGVFGYGSETLGTLTMRTDYRLNGHQLTSTTQLDPSRTLADAIFSTRLTRTSGDGDGAAASAIGTEIDSPSTTLTDGNSYRFKPKALYDNHYQTYAGEVGVSFEISGYDGFWWMNVRSPIYYCASSTSACYFVQSLPASPITAGYNG